MKQFFLIILMAIGAITSNACRCYHSTFTEEVAQADQIFIGTVLKKTSANQVYYLFSILQMFKGDKADTLTIRTGFGGPDCGMNFKVGETYIVYSGNKQTSRCRRNSPADNNIDLGKLKYLFQNGFSSDIGASANPVLTDNEAEFFNSELLFQRKDFDFYQRKVAFVLGTSFINKQQYFKDWGGKDVLNNIIILTEKEKQKNGFDVIIVSWAKRPISSGFRKRLIKRLM